jgi:hypothetical protein
MRAAIALIILGVVLYRVPWLAAGFALFILW